MIGNPQLRNINYETDILGNINAIKDIMPLYLVIEEKDSLTVARLKQDVQIEIADETFKVQNQV